MCDSYRDQRCKRLSHFEPYLSLTFKSGQRRLCEISSRMFLGGDSDDAKFLIFQVRQKFRRLQKFLPEICDFRHFWRYEAQITSERLYIVGEFCLDHFQSPPTRVLPYLRYRSLQKHFSTKKSQTHKWLTLLEELPNHENFTIFIFQLFNGFENFVHPSGLLTIKAL